MSDYEDSSDHIREEMSSLLDDACMHIGMVNNAVKRVDGLQSVLSMKRDNARSSVQTAMAELHLELKSLEESLLRDVQDAVKEKEDQLNGMKLQLVDHIKHTAAMCYRIEELLELGHEAELTASGLNLKKLVKELIRFVPEEETMSKVSQLEFFPEVENLAKSIRTNGSAGYLQCTPLRPALLAVSNNDGCFTKRVFRGIEEIIQISTGEEPVNGALKYLKVHFNEFTGENRETVEVNLINNDDGTYTAIFTPEKVGMYLLEITLYGKHIKGSPFQIMVVDLVSETESTGSKDSDPSEKQPPAVVGRQRRRKVSQQALSNLENYLAQNPPLKRKPEHGCDAHVSTFPVRNNQEIANQGGPNHAADLPQAHQLEVHSCRPTRKTCTSVSRNNPKKHVTPGNGKPSKPVKGISEMSAGVNLKGVAVTDPPGVQNPRSSENRSPKIITCKEEGIVQQASSRDVQPLKNEKVHKSFHESDICESSSSRYRSGSNPGGLASQGSTNMQLTVTTSPGEARKGLLGEPLYVPDECQQAIKDRDASSTLVITANGRMRKSRWESVEAFQIRTSVAASLSSRQSTDVVGNSPAQELPKRASSVPLCATHKASESEATGKGDSPEPDVLSRVSPSKAQRLQHSSWGFGASSVSKEQASSPRDSNAGLKSSAGDGVGSKPPSVVHSVSPAAAMPLGMRITRRRRLTWNNVGDNTSDTAGIGSRLNDGIVEVTADAACVPDGPPPIPRENCSYEAAVPVELQQDSTANAAPSPHPRLAQGSVYANSSVGASWEDEMDKELQSKGNLVCANTQPTLPQSRGDSPADKTAESSQPSTEVPLDFNNNASRKEMEEGSSPSSVWAEWGAAAGATGNVQAISPHCNKATGSGPPDYSGRNPGSAPDTDSGIVGAADETSPAKSVGKESIETSPSTQISPQPTSDVAVTAKLSTGCNVLEEIRHRNPGKGVKGEIVRQIGHCGRDEGGLMFPIGVTVNSKKEVIVCDNGNNAVKIFTWLGQHKFTIGGVHHPNFCHPSAVVTNESDEIIVKDDFKVQVYDSTGLSIRTFGKGFLKRPYGLSLNQYGHLVLLDHGRRPPVIIVYTQDGRLIRECDLSCLNIREAYGARCRFMTTCRDTVFIVDLGRSLVLATDFSGNHVGKFGCYGDSLGAFREPSGITADSYGNLLIADSKNNRIQIFTTYGKCTGVVKLTADIRRPSDIHLTDDGHLVIVNFLEHNIKVFKLAVDQ